LRADLASGSFFYSCAPQHELGALPSSRIKTASGPVTRAADTLVALNLTGLMPAKDNWAVLVDWTPTGAAGEWQTTVSLNSPGPAQRFTAATTVGTRSRFFQAWTGGGQNNLAISTYTDGLRRREIVGVSGGNLLASANGSVAVSMPYSMTTTNLDRLYIGSIDGTNQINAPIQQAILYPTCPSPAQMKAFSA